MSRRALMTFTWALRVSRTYVVRVTRKAIRTSRGRTLAAAALATAAALGVLELRVHSASMNAVAYLTFLLAATIGVQAVNDSLKVEE